MTIPIIAFLYLYLFFILIWLVFSVIAFYHIIKYGQIGFASLLAVALYLAAAAVILFLSYQFLSRIDWGAGLTVFQGGLNFFGANTY